MAVKKKAKPGRGGSKKRSRFNISAKAEKYLAAAGVLVLLIAALALVVAFAPKIFKSDRRAEERELEQASRRAAVYDRLLKDGVILGEDPSRETIFVAKAKWAALMLSDQEKAAERAAEKMEKKRCFILDIATQEQLGWYTVSSGYQQSKR